MVQSRHTPWEPHKLGSEILSAFNQYLNSSDFSWLRGGLIQMSYTFDLESSELRLGFLAMAYHYIVCDKL